MKTRVLTKPRTGFGETFPEVSSQMDLGGLGGASLLASTVHLFLTREWAEHLGVQAEFCLWVH